MSLKGQCRRADMKLCIENMKLIVQRSWNYKLSSQRKRRTASKYRKVSRTLCFMTLTSPIQLYSLTTWSMEVWRSMWCRPKCFRWSNNIKEFTSLTSSEPKWLSSMMWMIRRIRIKLKFYILGILFLAKSKMTGITITRTLTNTPSRLKWPIKSFF